MFIGLAAALAVTACSGDDRDSRGRTPETTDEKTQAEATRVFDPSTDWAYLNWSNLDRLKSGPSYLIRVDESQDYQAAGRVIAPGSQIRQDENLRRRRTIERAITFVAAPKLEAILHEGAPIDPDSWPRYEEALRHSSDVAEYCWGENADHARFPLNEVKIIYLGKIEDISLLPYKGMPLQDAIVAIHEDLFRRLYTFVTAENLRIRREHRIVAEAIALDADVGTYVVVPKTGGSVDVYVVGAAASAHH